MSFFDAPAFNDRLFFPRRDVSVTPPGAADLHVTVDGATLHLRLHRAEAPRATVLLFHGNGEVVADYDDGARMFADAGAALAVVDFRGYGASTGTPTLRSTIADAPRVLEAARAQTTGPLVVMGRSLGSACAAELYGMRPSRAEAFILESGASDLVGLVLRRGLRPPSSFAADDLAVFDPLPKLRRGDRPLLILHGAEDELIRPIEAKTAFEAARTSDKELVLVPGRGHNDLSFSAVYWRALGAFLARVT